jgi:hypothetical protein
MYKAVFLKCAETLPTRPWHNVEDQKEFFKIVPQKLNVIPFFDRISKKKFRVLYEA